VPPAVVSFSSSSLTSALAAPRLHAIDAALPSLAPHALDRRADCPKDTCTLSHLVPDEVRPALSDGAPLVLWEQRLGEHAQLAFPRDGAIEVAGIVLDGSLDMTPMEGHEAHAVGERFAAFHAPGGGVTLTSKGGKPVRVLLAVALAEATSSLDSHIALRDGLGASSTRRLPGGWLWKVRPEPIDFTSFADVPPLTWAQGAYHARVGWAGRSSGAGHQRRATPGVPGDRPAVVLCILQAAPGAPVPEADHRTGWESLVFLEGEGTLSQKVADHTSSIDARPGVTVTARPDAQTLWMPTGKAAAIAIVAYAPAGPEEIYRQLGAGVR
jgi:hypothetical protein